MNVLFLIPPPLDAAPPAERIFGCNYGIYHQPNIFLLYPATVLKKAGHEVDVLDFAAAGASPEKFEQFCRTQTYDVIFFYTVFLSRRTDLTARDLLSAHNRHTRFVFLATEPSASPEQFVNEMSVVVRGEPESRVKELLPALGDASQLAAIPGISHYDGDGIRHNAGVDVVEDLDALPFPDRSLLPPLGYHNPKLARQPFTTMLASRGCGFGCYYCVPNSLSFAREIEYKRENVSGKPPVRLRSAENVVQEFLALAAEGYRAISFIDDQFVWGKERTLAICEGIAGSGVEWSCLARSDMLLDYDVVEAMAKSGCRYVDIGIESFSQEILDYVGKGLKVDTVYSAVDNLKRAGIEPELNILLGSCPLETEKTIERTFREVLRLDVDYVLFSVCTPFPYTEFNRVAKREGWMIRPEYEPIDPMKESFISYPHLPKERLDTIIRSLYRRYYFRPSYIWKRLRRLESFSDFAAKAKAALTILR